MPIIIPNGWPHLVLEPDVGYAYYDENGLLTIHTKSVNVYLHRDMICEGLGLPAEQIRLVQNNAGRYLWL